MKPEKEPGLLEAVFNIDPGWDSLPDELMAPVSTRAQRKARRRRKRPWQKPSEECPNCGSAFPAGGVCPGCGLHDEEMPWGS